MELTDIHLHRRVGVRTLDTFKEKKANVFQAFFIMLPKIAHAAPVLFHVRNIAFLAQGISYGIIAPMTQNLFDSAVDFAAGKTELAIVLMGLLVLALAHVVKQAVNGIANFISFGYWGKIDGVLSLGLHRKISRIAPVCFEDTRILDDINKAVQGQEDASGFAGTVLFMLCTCSYYLVMALYLFNIKPLLMLLLALVFAPTFLTHFLRAKVFSKAEDKAAPVRRELGYYESCITGREYFKETRILGAFSYFRKLYADTLTLLNKLRFRASVKSDIAELGMQILSLAGYVGVLLLLLDSLLKSEISVGAFTAVFASVDQMFEMMKGLFDRVRLLSGNFGRVQNYIRFMQMPERNGADAELPADADITLNGVSFAYPGVEHKAIDNISLTIRNGETIAIVGENGSGKTTLVRLIVGLYLPDEGDILYGEADTKTVSASSLFKNISAVFQNYQRYQMTLRENIGISDVNDIASDAALDNICVQAGIDKTDENFAYGYDTMLSREFDGADLSGGQWQRVAIARSFFRSHQLIVLDEPTAAIDPIEETKIYTRFAEISKSKTAIIVTHRLGSAKLADRIIVMKHGKLAEQGTHDDLMAKNGAYAEMFEKQRGWYT